MSRWFSPFAAPEAPPPPSRPVEARRPVEPAWTPPPLPEPVPEAPRAPRRAGYRSLGPQIARELRKLKAKHGMKHLAKGMDVTTNTVRSAMSGVGIRLNTFEKLCETAGWKVTVTDSNGRTVIES